jgi:hypothetical protein
LILYFYERKDSAAFKAWPVRLTAGLTCKERPHMLVVGPRIGFDPMHTALVSSAVHMILVVSCEHFTTASAAAQQFRVVPVGHEFEEMWIAWLWDFG